MTVNDHYPVPTAGRIVHYWLNAMDAQQINQRRSDYNAAQRGAIPPAHDGRQNHVGNVVTEGDFYPAMIVKVWGGGTTNPASPNTACNLQVFLDGGDTYWATSRSAHTEPKPGSFTWPALAELPAEAQAVLADDGSPE